MRNVSRNPATSSTTLIRLTSRNGQNAVLSILSVWCITVIELLFCEQDGDENRTNDFIETMFLAPLDKAVEERFKDIRIFPLPVIFDRLPSTTDRAANRWLLGFGEQRSKMRSSAFCSKSGVQ
jgi:hypothetical protein